MQEINLKGSLDEQRQAAAAYFSDSKLDLAKSQPDKNLYKFFLGIAAEYYNMAAKTEEVMIEHDIRLTERLIAQWESAVGIPDCCFKNTGTLEQRRNQVIAKIRANGAQTVQQFREIAILLGASDITITPGRVHGVFPMKFPIYFFPSAKDAKFTAFVKLPKSLQPHRFAMPFPVVFGAAEASLIECFLNKLKPANVNLIFSYALPESIAETYENETSAILAQMTVQPTPERAAVINNTVKYLKTSGLWAKLDSLQVYAAHDAQAATVDWRDPSRLAVPVNAPPFTPDQGYAGDGSTSYVNTSFNPALSAVTYLLNSAHIGVWNYNDVQETAYDFGQIVNTTARLISYSASNQLSYRINDTTTGTNPAADSLGHYLVTRRASNVREILKNGYSVKTDAAVSTSITSEEFVVGRSGGAYATRIHSIFHAGAGLTQAESVNLYLCMKYYMDNI